MTVLQASALDTGHLLAKFLCEVQDARHHLKSWKGVIKQTPSVSDSYSTLSIMGGNREIYCEPSNDKVLSQKNEGENLVLC